MDLWKQRVVALVGTSSSDPTATMATMAGISTINLAVVGFRASASTLSDQREYPTFLRVNPVAADEIRSIVNVMQRTFLHLIIDVHALEVCTVTH